MNPCEPASPRVAVFGHSMPDEGTLVLAGQVGGWLARRGYSIVNGGYGGTMEASAKAARAAGGEVIGVTCRVWSSPANRYLTREVATPDILGRLGALLELATAGMVVLAGGTGTLLELAAAWELLNKRLMAARPLVCMGEFWRPVVERVIAAQAEAAGRVRFVGAVEELAEVFPPADVGVSG